MAEKIAVARREGTTIVSPPEDAGKIMGIVCFRDSFYVACEYGLFEYVDGVFHRLKFVHEEKSS